MTPELYAILRELRLRLRRTKGFALYYFFGNDTRSINWLKTQLDLTLRAMSTRLIDARVEDAPTLQAALEELLLPSPGKQKFPLFLHLQSAKAGDSSEPLAADQLLLRLNERRAQLVQGARPVFLLFETGLALHCATVAPDLWSVRTQVVHVPVYDKTPTNPQPKVRIDRLDKTRQIPHSKTLNTALTDWLAMTTQWRAAESEKPFLPFARGLILVQDLLQHRRLEDAKLVLLQLEQYTKEMAEGAVSQVEHAGYFQSEGDVRRALGRMDSAREAYAKSLEICERLCELTGQAPESLRGLSMVHERLGELALAIQDFASARQWFEKELKIGLQLVALNPDYEHFKGIVGRARSRLADLP